MVDIFLSYAKEDRDVAREIATLLGRAGWVVWWDRRIPAGRTWRSVLEEALREMRCMVVLWSAHSIESDWVRDEADEARARKKLVPVLIEAVNPPVGFRAIQAADLSEWDGSADAPGVRQLLGDLESLIGKPAQKNELGESGEISERADEGKSDLEHDPNTSLDLTDGLKSTEDIFTRRTLAGSWAELKRKINWKKAAAGGLGISLLLGVALFWRFQGDQSPPQPMENEESAKPAQAPQLANLTVQGERKEIKANETLSLTLRGAYSDGTESEINDGVEWQSSDGHVATVDAQGQVKSLEAGTTKITARYGGLVSPAWTLAVNAPETVKAPAAIVKPAPRQTPVEASAQKGAEASRVTLTPAKEQLKLKVAPYINRAKDYRVQGNYTAALAELEKARRVDPSNAEIAREIDQTKSACNAERKLGRKDLNC